MEALGDVTARVVERHGRTVAASTRRALELRVAQLEACAGRLGLDAPCQALYDAYVGAAASPGVRSDRMCIVRLVDQEARTFAVTPAGAPYNPPPLPTPQEAEAALSRVEFPVADGGADASDLARRAASELGRLGRSASTVSHYSAAWSGLLSWMERTLGTTAFTREACAGFASWAAGAMRPSAAADAARAARVLVAVADTGTVDDGCLRRRRLRGDCGPALRRAVDEAADGLRSAGLSPSTLDARLCCLERLARLGADLGVTEPCQDLYDRFVEGADTPDKLFQRTHAVRLVDAAAGTHATGPDGTPYNPEPLPTAAEAAEALAGVTFPVADGAVGTGALARLASSELASLGISASTVGQYEKAWRDLVGWERSTLGSTAFTRAACAAFAEDAARAAASGAIREWVRKIRRRCALVLVDVADAGRFEWRAFRCEARCGDGSLDALRRQYLAFARSGNLAESTVDLHDYAFRAMVSGLGVADAEGLAAVGPDEARRLLSELSGRLGPGSLATVVPICRRILAHLHAAGIVRSDVSGALPTPARLRTHMRPYLTEEDGERLVRALDGAPLRTRAMMLLAIRLGLRDCDICGLRLDEVDWARDRINIRQRKTGRPLSLPLLADVGNAIMDYLVGERPEADGCPYVFVRERAPHTRLSSMYQVCSGVVSSAGVEPVNRDVRGTQLLRHTLAHRLLDAGTPRQVITDALGHSSPESDKPYASMEERMLRRCPLDLSVVGDKEWEG